MNDWPFIGIKEGWIENEWTPEQMMKRSLEIKIPPQMCYLEPYYMNFLQQPNLNSLIKKQVEETRTGTGAAWISSNRLWTPGQTINIIFSQASKETMDSYSPGDIAWLQKVYGKGGSESSSGPIEKIDLRQLGIIQDWPDDLSDAEVEYRVRHFLSITDPDYIIHDNRLNSASECIMYPLILNYKQWDLSERVVSTPPAKYWPSSITQINIWFDRGTQTQHDSIKKWLIDNLQPHIRMNLVFEKAASGIVYTVIPPEEMGAITNPSNGQANWVPAGVASSIGYNGNKVYTIKINSGRGVKKSTILHEISHILGLYHSFDACKPGGECVKTDGDASIMSYVSPPEKSFSSVDIEWLERVYGPPKSKSAPSPIQYQFDVSLDNDSKEGYGTSIFIINIIIIWCIIFYVYFVNV